VNEPNALLQTFQQYYQLTLLKDRSSSDMSVFQPGLFLCVNLLPVLGSGPFKFVCVFFELALSYRSQYALLHLPVSLDFIHNSNIVEGLHIGSAVRKVV
jgi:hypothetical protein